MRYEILEWDIKDRRFAIIDECDAIRKRAMRMRYKVLCARYPCSSFRFVEISEKVLESRIVNRDAELCE